MKIDSLPYDVQQAIEVLIRHNASVRPWLQRLLTPAELKEIDTRADVDQAMIQQRKADRVQLYRSVKDRDMLLGHVQALQGQLDELTKERAP